MDSGNQKGKKESRKGFFQLFRESLKARMIAAIFATVAAVGLVFLDELKTFTREFFFYGTIEVIVEDQSLKKYSHVTILGADHSPQRTFLLKIQTSAKLAPGNYIIRIYYPTPDGSHELVFEKPFELKRRKKEIVEVTYKLPNIITVKLGLPKDDFVPEEQIHFTVMSDKDGFIWVFAPDNKGNPNPIFPNESYHDNRIEAGKKYTIPPYNTFTLQTRSTPGEEKIVSIVSEINDRQFALSCLKKVIPSVSMKISVTHEALWGYDKKTIKVK
jgi:hypothetical protein